MPPSLQYGRPLFVAGTPVIGGGTHNNCCCPKTVVTEVGGTGCELYITHADTPADEDTCGSTTPEYHAYAIFALCITDSNPYCAQLHHPCEYPIPDDFLAANPIALEFYDINTSSYAANTWTGPTSCNPWTDGPAGDETFPHPLCGECETQTCHSATATNTLTTYLSELRSYLNHDLQRSAYTGSLNGYPYVFFYGLKICAIDGNCCRCETITRADTEDPEICCGDDCDPDDGFTTFYYDHYEDEVCSDTGTNTALEAVCPNSRIEFNELVVKACASVPEECEATNAASGIADIGVACVGVAPAIPGAEASCYVLCPDMDPNPCLILGTYTSGDCDPFGAEADWGQTSDCGTLILHYGRCDCYETEFLIYAKANSGCVAWDSLVLEPPDPPTCP